MIQVSIYREKKNHEFFIILIIWTQLFHCKSFSATCPSFIPLPFSLRVPLLLTRPVGACITRAPRVQPKPATWPLGAEFNMLRWFVTSFLHLIFPSFSTPPLQGFNMFKVPFNKAIVVGLILIVSTYH